MNTTHYNEGSMAFLEVKNCQALPYNIGDIVCHVWVKNPGIDREWLKGYMDALIEYMQQNNINEI